MGSTSAGPFPGGVGVVLLARRNDAAAAVKKVSSEVTFSETGNGCLAKALRPNKVVRASRQHHSSSPRLKSNTLLYRTGHTGHGSIFVIPWFLSGGSFWSG